MESSIKYHYDLIQHGAEWKQARCGLLTASEMELVITPAKLQVANNDKSRSHMNEIAAQRITKYVEPTWFGGDMERGVIDEIDARNLYREHYGEVTECGFITNDKWGFTLGFSPDGLVGTDGQIEVKSRNQKHHTDTILANYMPSDFLIQVQTGLLVSERKWCDFISYCSGMPMFTHRVHADLEVQAAILTAATVFHDAVDARIKIWDDRMNDKTLRLIPTERKILEGDITV
jgi:hypothetical protein